MLERLARLNPRKSRGGSEKALRFIVSSAYANVPYYRDAFAAAAIHPRDVARLEDLATLPITQREDLLSSGAKRFLRSGVDTSSLVAAQTTGTSGASLTVYMSRPEALFRKTALLDSYARNARLTLPISMADVGTERKARTPDIAQRLRLVKVHRLFRAMPLQEQIDRLLDAAPALVQGRPSTLWELARGLRDRGIRSVRPRIVVSFGEILFPTVRELLAEVFGCRVVDSYNCEEIGNIAWECPGDPSRMHPNPATAVMEIVDRAGNPVPPGREGHVLLTNLYNRTMPLIRYSLGDRAVRLESGVCTCGFVGPAMRLVEGRDDDFLVLPDGREISPRLAYEVLHGALPEGGFGLDLIDAFKSFQIVQQEVDLIEVRVVPGPAYSRELWSALPERARALHPAMRVQIREVASLLSGRANEKFRRVTSTIDSRWKRERRASGLERSGD
jgi:phenylacetate-CoA ligase